MYEYSALYLKNDARDVLLYSTPDYAKGRWLDVLAKKSNLYRYLNETDDELLVRINLYRQLINESGTIDVVKRLILEMMGTNTKNIRIDEAPLSPGMLAIYLPLGQDEINERFYDQIKRFLCLGVIAVIYVRLGWDSLKWDVDVWNGDFIHGEDLPILWWDTIGVWNNALWGRSEVLVP